MKYEDFLKKKIKKTIDAGFTPKSLNKNLFEFQKHIVNMALKKGRYAIFADTGLGKTIMQIAWADEVVKHTKRPVLILAPLAVSGQTIQEGKKFGIEVEKYTGGYEPKIYISNYEQIDNISCSVFSGIVLDESSILKNFMGKMRNNIIETFKETPYKLACTATPSPNDLMELGNHSEFLNYMDRNEMLAMYFVHDGGETQKWRLKGHAKKDFYAWVGSWATVIVNPENIGFKDEGVKFKLPELKYYNNMVITPKKDNGLLFNETSVNATDFNRELRETRELRLKKVYDIIISNPDEYFLVWINHNEDERILRDLLFTLDFRIVTGSDKPEKKEKDLIDFSNAKYKILITKAKIAGMGMNFQHCHNQIFAGLDFSFEKLYQSVRRSYRFGQKDNVNIHLITTDTMTNVIETIQQKEKMFTELRQEMQHIINYEKRKLKMVINKENDIIKDDYKLLHGDCIQRVKEIDDESIGFTLFSPPFAELYVYSDMEQDIGNVKTYQEFTEHFEYLIPELERITQKGRLIAVHCMDLPIQKGKEGYIGIRDFPGILISMFQKYDMIFHSRVTIWKDPVIEMQRTKALGLLHKQVKKDSAMVRVGIPDYLLVFRKRGENKKPIKNTDIPVELWQKYASPVWEDINYSNTLTKWSARENEDEKHICPLQLDTITRALTLWSTENDTVFTPFMGIGSEVYQALKMNRKAIGIELKKSYFDQAVKNIESVVEEKKQAVLF